MNKDFIPYQQALALKHIEFNEPCFGYYNGQGNYIGEEGKMNSDCNKLGMHGAYCTAPTFSQVFRWFRENYQMVFCYEPCLKKDLTYIFFIYMETTGEKVFVVESEYNEEAELASLLKLIEIVKNKTL